MYAQSEVWNDIGFAFRQLRRNPTFTIVAVLTLGLGIGMNATIFSLFDGLVLHPYGFDTSRLVSITPVFSNGRVGRFLSPPEFDTIRSQAMSFESVATYDIGNWNLTGVSTPERLVVAYLTPELFETYGVAPMLGRAFLPEETRDPGARVVIISHRLWQNQFASAPGLPGSEIQLNGAPYHVAGVLPPRVLLGWPGVGGTDVYVPWIAQFDQMPRGFREMHVVDAMPLNAGLTLATAGYFEALRISLLRGRLFEAGDDLPNRPIAAIVNDQFARELFPTTDPIGKNIRAGGQNAGPWMTIVGVVASTRDYGLERAPQPQVYTPAGKDPGNWNQLWIVARAQGEARAMIGPIRQAIRSIDRDQPVYRLSTLDEAIGTNLLQRRTATWLISVFGLVALLLATVGLYGVVAYSAAQRVPEIGVRVALGATPHAVLRLVLGQGMRLSFIGMVAGLAVAIACTRFASALLYDVSPTDPFAFAVTTLILLLTTLLASYLPARRATKLDPMVVLRRE